MYRSQTLRQHLRHCVRDALLSRALSHCRVAEAHLTSAVGDTLTPNAIMQEAPAKYEVDEIESGAPLEDSARSKSQDSAKPSTPSEGLPMKTKVMKEGETAAKSKQVDGKSEDSAASKAPVEVPATTVVNPPSSQIDGQQRKGKAMLKQVAKAKQAVKSANKHAKKVCSPLQSARSIIQQGIYASP